MNALFSYFFWLITETWMVDFHCRDEWPYLITFPCKFKVMYFNSPVSVILQLNIGIIFTLNAHTSRKNIYSPQYQPVRYPRHCDSMVKSDSCNKISGNPNVWTKWYSNLFKINLVDVVNFILRERENLTSQSNNSEWLASYLGELLYVFLQSRSLITSYSKVSFMMSAF